MKRLAILIILICFTIPIIHSTAHGERNQQSKMRICLNQQFQMAMANRRTPSDFLLIIDGACDRFLLPEVADLMRSGVSQDEALKLMNVIGNTLKKEIYSRYLQAYRN